MLCFACGNYNIVSARHIYTHTYAHTYTHTHTHTLTQIQILRFYGKISKLNTRANETILVHEI